MAYIANQTNHKLPDGSYQEQTIQAGEQQIIFGGLSFGKKKRVFGDRVLEPIKKVVRGDYEAVEKALDSSIVRDSFTASTSPDMSSYGALLIFTSWKPVSENLRISKTVQRWCLEQHRKPAEIDLNLANSDFGPLRCPWGFRKGHKVENHPTPFERMMLDMPLSGDDWCAHSLVVTPLRQSIGGSTSERMVARVPHVLPVPFYVVNLSGCAVVANGTVIASMQGLNCAMKEREFQEGFTSQLSDFEFVKNHLGEEGTGVTCILAPPENVMKKGQDVAEYIAKTPIDGSEPVWLSRERMLLIRSIS